MFLGYPKIEHYLGCLLTENKVHLRGAGGVQSRFIGLLSKHSLSYKLATFLFLASTLFQVTHRPHTIPERAFIVSPLDRRAAAGTGVVAGYMWIMTFKVVSKRQRVSVSQVEAPHQRLSRNGSSLLRSIRRRAPWRS